MANFEIAYNKTARWEGGYQDMPEDTGNYNSWGELVGTNWGISAPVYEAWIGRPPTKEEMQLMPKSVAKQIYRAKFWNAIEGDLIQNQAVANILYDGRVNHGRTGVKLMQRVLNVNDDGSVGPQTLNAINTGNSADIYNRYKAARKNFYEYLIQQNPQYEVFRNGWMNRINSFNEFSGVANVSNGVLLPLMLAAIGYFVFVK